MASYTELAAFLSPNDDSGLRQKIAVAAFVTSDAIRQEADDGTAEVRQRKRYAKRILMTTPDQAFLGRADGGYSSTILEAIYRAILIANKDASVAQISAATDAQIQTAVSNAISFLAAEFPDPVTP